MKFDLFSLKLNSLSFNKILDEIVNKAKTNSASYLCAVNVHMTVEAQKDVNLKNAVNNATWAVTDGVPVLWAFNYFGKFKQERIAGMDLTPALLREANNNGLVISAYGNTQENLDDFKAYINKTYPNLKIGILISPPFRALSLEEEDAMITQLNAKNSQIVFVSLGCPKQEKWMFQNSHRINGVCLGIGNAINTTIGKEKRPSVIFQKMGLEWVFRLMQNPTRLIRRYMFTNSKFCFMLLKKQFRLNK